MGKHTKKVGITGKYGTRYGASVRKQVKKMEISQHAKFTCVFCGKVRTAHTHTATHQWARRTSAARAAAGALGPAQLDPHPRTTPCQPPCCPLAEHETELERRGGAGLESGGYAL